MKHARFLLAILVLSAVARADKHPLIGEWRLVLERPGMQPRQCRADVSLDRRAGKWTGWIRFRTILFGKRHELTNIVMRGGRFTFDLADRRFKLAFDGERDGMKKLKGTCAWRGLGDYSWHAMRAGGPVVLIDKGLSFGREFSRGEAKGIDVAALRRLIAVAEETGSSAVCVVRDGKVVAERHFGGKPRPIHVMSVTKFFTAMAIAYLVEDKKIASLDAPLSTWFPEWKDGQRAKVTLRQVLAHTSGIQHAKRATELNGQDDKVAWVRRHKVVTEPGKEFSYNNDAIALLSGVIRKASGKSCDMYLKKKLFGPLGIRVWKWNRDKAGNALTYAELQMTARDLAKVGWLIANGGKWKGRQIFPAAWTKTLAQQGGPNESCGLVWWRAKHPKSGARVIYHTGYLGQWLVVYPKQRLVGVRLRAGDGSEDASREFGAFLKMLLELSP